MTIRETIRKIAPVIGNERANRLWRAYLVSDTDGKRALEYSLEAYVAKALDENAAFAESGHFPPPPPERCLGDFDLGKVLYGGKEMYSFGLRLQEMLRHAGLYGSSGSGKSNGIALILDGLIANKIPFLLVDFKRTFRALLKDYPDLLVFTAGDADTAPFRFNPLIPPEGTSTQVWLRKVTSALSHGFMQGAGSESLLITAMTDAYEHASQEHRWPTFLDVAKALDEVPAKGRKGMWLDSAKRAVTSLTEGNARDVFCHNSALDMVSLLKEDVILELDLLNQAEQTFLSETLLLWLIQYRMNQSGLRETLQHAILIEEAHHLLRTPPGVGDGGEPVIHIALREVRELGESIILATQNASVVPVTVFGNQATTLAFHTKHAADVRATAQAMLLKDECKDELGRLPVGEAIVRVPRWTEPVRIRLNYRPIEKGTITDAHIREHMRYRAYSNDTAAFCRSMAEQAANQPIPQPDDKSTRIPESEEPSTIVSTIHPVDTSPTTTPKKDIQRDTDIFPGPSPLELQMLQDICKHPFAGVVQRIKRLAVSRRKGHAALKALEERGIIKPETIYTGTSLIKLFDIISPTGRALCHKHHYNPLPDITEGGVLHRYWVHHTANKLRDEGWNVKTEYRVNDNLIVDIHAEKDNKTMAVLVETGKSDVRKNMKKTMQAFYEDIKIIPVAAICHKRG